MEVSKVVLTELPLRSVFQESTTPDSLQEYTPLSPARIEENDGSAQDIQTDDEILDQDSSFEGSCTKEEERPNPEVVLSLNSTTVN